MIELIQCPWSPFCIVQRRILEYAGVRFRIVNIPNTDRRKVWKLTRGRYYQVPIVKDGRTVVFETDAESQVIAKYLDDRLRLDLFPRSLEGLQDLLWRDIEDRIEGFTFKLNDIYWREFLPRSEALDFVRHKERKFGRGCLDQWAAEQAAMLGGLARGLVPYEQMLRERPFLLDQRPRFVDFDLYGMLGNFLFSGHYRLPPDHSRLGNWYRRMTRATSDRSQ